MTDEEKKALKDAQDALTAATAKITELSSQVEILTQSVKDKDLIIEKKTKDVVGARQETQRLKDLTEEQRKEMTDAEIRLHEATLQLQKDTEKFQNEQIEAGKKEVGSRQEAIIRKLSGGKEDIAAKIRENFNKLDPALREKATTEDEIAPLMNSAYDMLGALKPDPLAANANAGDGAAPGQALDANNFADSAEGKALLGFMGLPTEDAKKPAA